MPIHSQYRKVLQAMTKKYCKGKLDKNQEGIKTCQKALSVFYATMKTKNIDYTKAPTEETITQLEQLTDIDKMIDWYMNHEFSN